MSKVALWKKVYPVPLEMSPGKLCRLAYPGHLHGCPNFGKKEGCPPEAKYLEVLMNLSSMYVIWNVFPFGEHVQRMRLKHPKWSERQVRCCLYWQGTARKQLRERVNDFLSEHSGMGVVWCPEASGLNVTETMAKIGGVLEWPPETVAYQVVIAGVLK